MGVPQFATPPEMHLSFASNKFAKYCLKKFSMLSKLQNLAGALCYLDKRENQSSP